MNITFLIGNGFDLNLGLKTKYVDFLKKYINTSSDDSSITNFKNTIEKNLSSWADAEKAFGEYAIKYSSEQIQIFSECHLNFCVQLASYLKNEENKLDYDNNKDIIVKTFSTALSNIALGLPPVQDDQIKSVFQQYFQDHIVYNFINFNYTNTLDECVNLIKQTPNVLGKHNYGSSSFNHQIGKIIHVHGTTDKGLVLGLNDEDQIKNQTLFEGDNDIYKNQFIKIKTNESLQENRDLNAKKLLNESQIIYIYGMSLGHTDTIWWNRICIWLKNGSNCHLIIHQCNAPYNPILPIKYQIYEKNKIQEFLSFSSFSEEESKLLENRIHIVKDNIFNGLSTIANSLEIESTMLKDGQLVAI